MHRAASATAVMTLAMAAAFPNGAEAGGFAIKERSAKAQGLSFAGVTAGSGGLSSMSFNPAAIGTIKSGGEIAGGASLISTVADGDVSLNGVPNGEEVHAGGPRGLANAYAGYRIEPDGVYIGISFYTPFGLATKYNPSWTGRADGLTSELRTLNFAPTLAWQPIPEITIGGAVNIMYADARLTSGTNLQTRVPGLILDGDDVSLGFSVGAMFKPVEGTTIGVAYQHGYNLDLSGQAQSAAVPGTYNVTADTELPSTVSLGITQDITDRIRVMGELQWQNWSVFDQIDINIPAFGPRGVIGDPQDYDDAFYVAFGGEYDLTPAWTVRAGAAWDQTPTQDPDLAAGFFGRTVRVPDDDRIWLSVGASYAFSEAITVDAGYSYLFAPDDPVVALRTVPGGTVTYDASAHIFSVGGSFRF